MKLPIRRAFAAAKSATALELFVYDVIGEDFMGEGVTPQKVTDAIKSAGKLSSITVRLNSPGGSSFDGVAIHNILRQQGVPVNVIVEGLAASAAFTIAMAGDTIKVCDAGMMMLHNAWGVTAGPASDMRQMADLLDKVSGTMRDMYAKRAGMKPKAVAALMDAETWLTGEEAVAQGFATALLPTTPEQNKETAALVAQFDLRKFAARIPAKLKQGVRVPPGPPGGPESEVACECPCSECTRGDCDGCSHAGCDCVGCTCEDAQALAKMKSRGALPLHQRLQRQIELERALTD